MVEKTGAYGTRKTIMIGQDSYYIALPIVLSGSPNDTIKAGEPLTGDIEKRGSNFTAATESPVGINLHDVKLDAQGKGNGTLVIVGCVDLLKLDEGVKTNVDTAKESLPRIIFVEGSKI